MSKTGFDLAAPRANRREPLIVAGSKRPRPLDLRAERRCGRLLKETEKAKGRQAGRNPSRRSRGFQDPHRSRHQLFTEGIA